jgi:SAM-dependent methyltransferase
MKIFSLQNNLDNFYASTYDLNFWFGFAGCNQKVGMRMFDAWPAFCYAHGIYNNIPYIYSISEQIEFVKENHQRLPRNILEIGSGRGEVSVSFAMMKYNVTSLDVNPTAIHHTQATARDLFGRLTDDNHSLYIGDLSALSTPVFEHLDTVVLVESIEHIYPDEWWNFWQRILPYLKKNQAHLVITNEPEYWPLGDVGDCAPHISLINDNFYDRLSEDAASTRFRQTSHIALQF